MKYQLILIFIAVFYFSVLGVQAQSNSRAPQAEKVQSSAPEGKKSTRKKNRRKDKKDKETFREQYIKGLEDKKEEFHKRMKDNAKRDRKLKRKMEHPQYSDFSYFGHKKPPKKRPVGKRKLCKECGIVH